MGSRPRSDEPKDFKGFLCGQVKVNLCALEIKADDFIPPHLCAQTAEECPEVLRNGDEAEGLTGYC